MDVAFNIQICPQSEGGYSVAIVFEPMASMDEAEEFEEWVAKQLAEFGWDCGRTQ